MQHYHPIFTESQHPWHHHFTPHFLSPNDTRLNKSRGQRIVWLLEELNLEYDIEVYKRDENKRAGPELKAIHALGKSPTIGIRPAGAEKDIIVTESETIVEYICEHFGKHMIPQRYPEGKEGILGAETEDWMRYKVCLYSRIDWNPSSDMPA
jgi:glutathione S-transferase